MSTVEWHRDLASREFLISVVLREQSVFRIAYEALERSSRAGTVAMTEATFGSLRAEITNDLEETLQAFHHRTQRRLREITEPAEDRGARAMRDRTSAAQVDSLMNIVRAGLTNLAPDFLASIDPTGLLHRDGGVAPPDPLTLPLTLPSTPPTVPKKPKPAPKHGRQLLIED